MFLRGLLLSLPDIGKIYDIEGLQKDTDTWPLFLGVIATTNILATAAVFLSLRLIHEGEREMADKSLRNE